MAQPRLILLDEPGAGVNPTLLEAIVDRIVALNRQGITFLIIEHNMDLVMSLCSPIMVMAQGRLLTTGTAHEVSVDPRVVEAYLGGLWRDGVAGRVSKAGYEPGLPIVRGASLAVEPNEILAVLGPNGAGKSTLVKAIAGLVGRRRPGRSARARDHRTRGPSACARRARLRASDGQRVRQPLDRRQSRSRCRHPESAERRLGDLYALFPDLARQRRLS